MATFVSRKIELVFCGNVAFLCLVATGAFLFNIGYENIASNLLIGMLMVSMLPVALYLAAKTYQKMVVGNCRQLSLVDDKEVTHFKRSVLMALKSAFESTRYVPMLVSAMTAVSALLLVSPLIVIESFKIDSLSLQFIGCLAVSAQVLLASEAIMLALNAYRNLFES